MMRDSFNAISRRQNQRSENAYINRGQHESSGDGLICQPFFEHYSFSTVLSLAPMFGLFPWLSAVPPFTQVDLVITGEGGRQVTVRLNFWVWLSTMATPLDLYRLNPAWRITVPIPQDPTRAKSRRVKRTAVSKDGSRSSPEYATFSAAAERGIVSCKVKAASKRSWRRKDDTPDLLIEPGWLGQEGLYGLIDDWIVRHVVERRMRSSISEPASEEKG